MKHPFLKYLLTVMLLSTACFADPLKIIPEPKEYKFNNERFQLLNSSIQFKAIENDKPVSIAIEEIRELLKSKFDVSFKSGSASQIILKKDKIGKVADEGYVLTISKNKITVEANTDKGLFYGLQSFKQLLKDPEHQSYLQGCKIVDWPDYKIRAISDDISRGPIPTLDYMKLQIRRLAELKVNTIIHYVEHVVKTKSHPEFAPDDGSLTIEEWKEIADYAMNYNVMIIGGFQSFGHFNNILNTPEYAHLGESGSLISPVMEESYTFLEDIYDEMIPAFHSPYFNINCDETFDLGKEKSKALVDSLGYAEVFYRHIMRLYNIVKKYDKQVIMWGDILLEYPVLLEKLPKDILIGIWTYDPLDNFDEHIKPIKDAGFEFWVVPGLLNSRRIYPNYYQAPKNIRNFAKDGLKYGASGLLNCFWDDGSIAFFSLDWYGAAYGAEKSWNTSSDDTSFDRRFNSSVYGDKNNNFSKIIWKLSELAGLEPTDGLNSKVLFEKILPDSGKDLKLSLNEWDKVLEICKDAEKHSENTDLSYFAGDLDYQDLIIDIYISLALERLELFSAANQYSHALSIQKTDEFKSRSLTLNSIESIDGNIERLREIKDKFELLWLKENHTYAVDWTTDKFEEKIQEFSDVKERLIRSLKKLDSSESLLKSSDVRLSITKLPGKYFTEWMIINPITHLNASDLISPDYLNDMGGESDANPKVTQEFYYKSQKLRWGRFVSPYPDVIDMKEKFTDRINSSVVYAFANISVENDTTVTASVGFDEAVEIFINGRSVFKAVNKDGFKVDYQEFELDLSNGKNNLLIKSANTTGEWKFSFRLPGSKVRNSKNRYRILR